MVDPVFRFEIGRTPQTSKVIYLPTGEIVEGVKGFSYQLDAATGVHEATITIHRRWFEVVEAKPKKEADDSLRMV